MREGFAFSSVLEGDELPPGVPILGLEYFSYGRKLFWYANGPAVLIFWTESLLAEFLMLVVSVC